MLKLEALGAFGLRDLGGHVQATLTQPKRVALLAYLALARPRGFHRRDTLLALFWPELDSAHARNALSQALTFLRRELPAGILVTRGSDEVGLDLDRVECDVVAFEAAVDEAQWPEAVDLYRGDLLAGLHVSDAPGFERWLDAERDRLRKAASRAAWSLAGDRLEAGEPVAAERSAQRALALSPTDESPVRWFIEGLARAGDRAAALRFYEKFQALLAEELEVEPAAETAKVAEAVRNGQLVAKGSNVSESPVAAASEMEAIAGAGAGRNAARGAAGSTGPPIRRRRATTALLVVVGCLAIAVAAYVGVDGWRRGRAAGVLENGEPGARVPIVLADFGAPATDSILGELVTEALRIDLLASPVVTVAPEELVVTTLERMRRDPSAGVDEAAAREAAVRRGWRAVLAGEVREVAGSFVLTARMVTPTSGRVLAAFRETAADSTELIPSIDRLSEEIRSAIGESLRSVRASPPLSQVTTSSLPALRLYTQGRYEEAVALDSAFAMAWRRWGVVLSIDGVLRAKQIEAITRAYRLRDRLPFRERSWAVHTYHTHVTGDFTRAEQALRTILGSFPDDAGARNNLGIILYYRQRWEAAAEQFRKAYETRPQAIYLANLARVLLSAGLRDSAFVVLDSAETAFPELLGPRRTRAWLLTRDGRYEASDSVAARLRARTGPEPVELGSQSPTRWFAHGVEAENDAARGRIEAALGHLEQRQRLARLSGPELAVQERIEMAATAASWLAAIAGDRQRARAELVAILEAVPLDSLLPLDRPYGDLAAAFALAGDTKSARRYAAAYDSVGPDHWTLGDDQFLPARMARGLVDLEEGRPEEALRHFHRLQDEVLACSGVCVLPFVGRAHELADRPDSAIAAYAGYLDRLDTRGLVHDPISLSLTLQRLPTLYEGRGESDRAARLYARFTDLWKDADPELQPRVRALRERAAALVGERDP